MIRDLLAVLAPAERRTAVATLVWMVAAAVLQGIAVAMLVPILVALFDGDTAGTVRWLVVLCVVGGFALVAHYVQAMRNFQLALTILSTLRERLGDHIVRLPLGWFEPDTAGRLSRAASSGALTVGQSTAHLLQPLVVGVVSPGVVCVFLLAYDWRLGVVAAAAAPVLYACFRYSARALGLSDELAHEAGVEANAAVLEFGRCQPVLRAFGYATEAYAPLERAIEKQRIVGRRQLWMTVPGMALTSVTLQLAFSVFIVVGIWLALRGDVDEIMLVAVLALLARFIGPLATVNELSGGMRMARNDLHRIRAVLDAPPLPEPTSSSAIGTPGVVEFDDVTFGYVEQIPVLRNVSFSAVPGSITAIVGASGAGKSTVTRLIARFWDVDLGAVRVGGVDVRDQRDADLRSQLSLVFQDVYLFNDSLRANVALGRYDATDTEIDEAAGLSGVDEIVERLPDGWDTVVGEAGARLSGGERQRVSVARALLKSAPIVVLDEATAALDPANEYLVRRSVASLATTSTIIVVAHTPAMISLADNVVMLGEGAVLEGGARADLLTAGGAFAEMFAEREQAASWRLVRQ